MKLSFSPREQRIMLLGSVFTLLGVWVYGTYLVGPLLREGGRLGQEVRSLREHLKQLQEAAAGEAGLREQQQRLSQVVESLRGQLPAEAEIPAVIEHLSSLASQTGVKIQTIFPQRQTESPKGEGARRQEDRAASPLVVYKDIPIQIDALAGYHQLGTFLSFVETSDKPMQVTSLRITSNTKEMKRHTIRLVLRLYFAVADEVPAT